MSSKFSLGLVATLSCSAASAATNLVTDGSFESPNVLAGGNYVLFNAGSTGITGWTVLAPTPAESVALNPDTFLGLKASDGRQWIDMTGDTGYNKGLRSDAIATTVGVTYHVSFDLGNYLPFDIATLGLSVNGGPEQLYTNNSLAVTATNPMNWASFGFDWLATSNSLQLSFVGRANGVLSNNLGIGLDNVAVFAPVPEPGSWGLMALGLCAVGWRPARRR